MNTKTYLSWTKTTGSHDVDVDMANEDSLMFQVTASGLSPGNPVGISFFCSADGEHWSDRYVMSGMQQFDQPNYSGNSWGQTDSTPEMYCVPEFTGAGLRWVRMTISIPASASAFITVRGGVAGR